MPATTSTGLGPLPPSFLRRSLARSFFVLVLVFLLRLLQLLLLLFLSLFSFERENRRQTTFIHRILHGDGGSGGGRVGRRRRWWLWRYPRLQRNGTATETAFSQAKKPESTRPGIEKDLAFRVEGREGPSGEVKGGRRNAEQVNSSPSVGQSTGRAPFQPKANDAYPKPDTAVAAASML